VAEVDPPARLDVDALDLGGQADLLGGDGVERGVLAVVVGEGADEAAVAVAARQDPRTEDVDGSLAVVGAGGDLVDPVGRVVEPARRQRAREGERQEQRGDRRSTVEHCGRPPLVRCSSRAATL